MPEKSSKNLSNHVTQGKGAEIKLI